MANGVSLHFDERNNLTVGYHVSIESAKKEVARKAAAAEKSKQQMEYLGSIPIPVAMRIKIDHGLDVMLVHKFTESERLKLGRILRSEYPHLLRERKRIWR